MTFLQFSQQFLSTVGFLFSPEVYSDVIKLDKLKILFQELRNISKTKKEEGKSYNLAFITLILKVSNLH